jgi:UDP-N-acetylmuramate dehydrogenase
MKIFYDYQLREKNTFGLNSIAKRFISISSIDDLHEIAPTILNQKYLILGGGSNIVLPDYFDGTVLELNIKHNEVFHLDNDYVTIKAGAGESWHYFVESLVKRGYGGFENLALIPGKVGAAPIQNIGAYGVEQNKFLDKVEVFDLKSCQVFELDNITCNFGYRTSYFKQNKHNFVVTAVYYKFPLNWKPVLDYKDIREKIENDFDFVCNPENIFNLVCQIRRNKLPDPSITGNAGSFFKNPIVSEGTYQLLQNKIGPIHGFKESDGYKISAAILIEKSGWKRKKISESSGISVSPSHSLVIINNGTGKYEEIIELSQSIIDDISDKYGVVLEREVNIIL